MNNEPVLQHNLEYGFWPTLNDISAELGLNITFGMTASSLGYQQKSECTFCIEVSLQSLGQLAA